MYTGVFQEVLANELQMFVVPDFNPISCPLLLLPPLSIKVMHRIDSFTNLKKLNMFFFPC